MVRNRRRTMRPTVDRLDDRCLLTAVPLPMGLSPVQLKSAYGLNAIQFQAGGLPFAGDGSGQTIAIIDAYHDPNLLTDLRTFDKTFGLSDPELVQINMSGDWNTNDGWAGETVLDVEWAHAMAPGAKIVVVEASSDLSNDAFIAAIDVARNLPGVSAISMSFGAYQNFVPNAAALDIHFTTPAGHQGITFIASSGDSGTGTQSETGGPQWPAQSPNVLAVGGTTLAIKNAAGYGGESIWNGSGGGYSSFVPEPAYQYSLQQTGKRSIPDVAFVADPNTGVAIYFTPPSFGPTGGFWQQIGGTSLSAPLWSGVMAIVNQGRAFQGLKSLDGPTQTLPTLYSLPATDFKQVAAFGPGFGVNYQFGPRSANSTVIQTGLGSVGGVSLINDLINPPPPRVIPPPPAFVPPPTFNAFGSGNGTGNTMTTVATTVVTKATHPKAPAHKTASTPAHKVVTHKTTVKKATVAKTKTAAVASATTVHQTATTISAADAAAQAQLIAAFDAAIPAVGSHN